MTDKNCIFCKILAGDIPSAVVYEDEEFKVILDVGPAAKGHMLILPKEHYSDILTMPEELVAKAFILAKKMAAKMESVLGCDTDRKKLSHHFSSLPEIYLYLCLCGP